MQPRVGGRVPEAREVEIAARAQRGAELSAPTAHGGSYEQRAGEQALQTPVAALEPQVRAARGEGARRLLPAHGGGDGRCGRREEAVVTQRRQAGVDGDGRRGLTRPAVQGESSG